MRAYVINNNGSFKNLPCYPPDRIQLERLCAAAMTLPKIKNCA